MNPLLYNFYAHGSETNRTKLFILYLLHELRILSRNQITWFVHNEYRLHSSRVDAALGYLSKNNLIGKYRNGNMVCYYLTKEGHLSIGGLYTFPKVPEYNLDHHLQINDYLITTIKLLEDHPHLKFIMSERRQVYETKDFQENSKGRKYFVPDYIVRFLGEDEEEIDWSFEIELTLKSRTRYREGIFPKYIRELKNEPNNHLLYVTPSPQIKRELDIFREIFFEDEGEDNHELFDRLHIVAAENFQDELSNFIRFDSTINW